MYSSQMIYASQTAYITHFSINKICAYKAQGINILEYCKIFIEDVFLAGI